MAAVLFDLDGTLHDRAGGLTRFAASQFRRLGGRDEVTPAFVDRFLTLDANGANWKDVVYGRLLKEFSFAADFTVGELVADYVTRFPSFAVRHEGALEALHALRTAGFMIGILTNGKSGLQRAVIRALDLDGLVDLTLISEEVGLRKPDPKIFELALTKLGTIPGETTMVGDDPTADIEGALQAGLRAIGVGHARFAAGTDLAPGLSDAVNLIIQRHQYASR